MPVTLRALALRVALMCAVSSALVGCAGLDGVPVQSDLIFKDSRTVGDLEPQLAAAKGLRDAFVIRRNYNLRFNFWTNASLVPLALGSATSVAFSASKATIAGFALGIGGVGAMRTVVNSKDNAKVYQAGVTALTCEISLLAPYKGLPVPDTSLSSQVSNAGRLLDLTGVATPQTTEEVVSVAGALSDLKAAVTDASAALEERSAVADLYARLPLFVSVTNLTIEDAVATKLSQGDVDASALEKAFAPTLPARGAAAAATAGSKGGPEITGTGSTGGTRAVVTPAPVIPLADRLKQIREMVTATKAETASLRARLKIYALPEAEDAVKACVKKIS